MRNKGGTVIQLVCDNCGGIFKLATFSLPICKFRLSPIEPNSHILMSLNLCLSCLRRAVDNANTD